MLGFLAENLVALQIQLKDIWVPFRVDESIADFSVIIGLDEPIVDGGQ
jgi:hypothetical protein